MTSISELKRADEAERIHAIRSIVDDVAARIKIRDLTRSEAMILEATCCNH